MVDVFISYARDDRALAEGMAELLKAAGHSVWWDRDLGGGEAFSDVIERNLREAKSVVVLWTDASIKSLFVRDEAGRAAAAGKLVPVRTADVSVSRLPVGFGAYHTLLLSERDEIRRAVARLTGRPWEEPEESSFSAARKAASRYYYARRWPLLTSSALALAGGLMWLAIFAKGEPACEGVPVREISSSMWNNIQLNYLDNAQSRAEQLLRCDAASVSGLSGLGSIGFYKGEYPQAAAMFEKALATRPKDFILTLNLADAEV